MKLSSLNPEHLECRSMGHAWTHVDDHDHQRLTSTKQIVRFWRIERCLRCTAEREREVDLSRPDRVQVKRSRMRYPAGYVIHAPRRRVTRGDALGAQYGREVHL